MDYLRDEPFYDEPVLSPTVNLELIRQLIALVEQEDLAELVVTQGAMTILVRGRSYRPPALVNPFPPVTLPPAETAPVATTETEESPAPTIAVSEERLFHITAPLTGVFYSRPRPDAPPFVTVGSEVEPGQVVALVEAMKFFNEVRSEVRGIVREILAKDQQLVKHGDTLMVLERLD